ncbi:MAG TPA: 3-hydroxyacyl-ACP dehydratase FabZ family protein [Pseudonocardiaceae bacterium]|nr:3-hydroxyacyl-ACP dehydratase FabZ family protein [Pseudonocardiaceae bacterium]
MIGIAEIMEKLPHRCPMLLVDQLIEFVPGEHLTGVKAVTASEPWFRTILPGEPVVFPPGLLIESWCQAAALLAVWDAPHPSVLDGEMPLLGSLSDVTFDGSVEPGSVVLHHARLIRDFGNTLIFRGTSTVDDRTVLRVGRMFMVIRPTQPPPEDAVLVRGGSS